MIKITALCTLAILAVAGLTDATLRESEVQCLVGVTDEMSKIADIYPSTALLKSELEAAGLAGAEAKDGELPIGELPETTVNDCYKVTLMFNAALLYTLCDDGSTAVDVADKFWKESDAEQDKVLKSDRNMYELLHQGSYCDLYIQNKLEKVAKA